MNHLPMNTRRRGRAFVADARQPAGKLIPLVAAIASLSFATAAHAQAQETTLSTVTVKADAQKPDGHLATKTRVGKVVQDPHDVPQAITTITRGLIEEQEANSLREALRNVSGLSFNAAEGGRSGDNMMLRGFYTFGDIYLDGIRDTAQYNREVFNLEQVDVLRGAAAMLFGRGQAGGVINQVSKTPMLYGINKVGVGVGTNGFFETKADLNQRLGETTAFRLNMMNRDEDSSRSNLVSGTTPEIHRQGIAPSIAFGLGTNHEVVLSHLWVQTNDRPDYGVPFNNAAKKPESNWGQSTYWGASGNFDESQTNVSTLSYLWKISPDTQWRTVARAANYYRSYWAVAPQGALTANSLSNLAKTREFDTDNFVLQSDFSTAFNLLGMRHELLTGVEYLKEDSKRWTLANLGTTTRPLYKSGHYTSAAPNTYNGDTYSAYLQDTVEFVKDWKATVGVRRDEMRSSYQAPVGTAGASTSYRGDFGENSYRTGLSWQPSAAQHYYLGWSDSFSPTADLYQLSGSAFPAERSKVSEIGGKWLLLDGNLAFRASLYNAVKNWERNTDLEATASVLTQKRHSNGLELELAGRVTDKWEVFSGLSLIDAEIDEVAPRQGTTYGNANFVGRMPRNTPKQTFNLWSTYALPYGFKVGGGMEFKSKRYGGAPTTNTPANPADFNPNWVPSYTRWDAMVAYEQAKYAVKFNIQNVFDKLYYDAIYDNGGFTYVGQPRRFILSAEYKF